MYTEELSTRAPMQCDSKPFEVKNKFTGVERMNHAAFAKFRSALHRNPFVGRAPTKPSASLDPLNGHGKV